jgi:hypothetical protein
LVTLCIQFSAACVLAVAVESDDVRVRIEVHLSELAAAEAGNGDIYVAGSDIQLKVTRGTWRDG